MSKMNWDRVRWETRAIRGGSEWVNSDSLPPPPSAAPSKSVSVAAAMPKKKKKKKKKASKTGIRLGINAAATHKPLTPIIVDQSRVSQASASPNRLISNAVKRQHQSQKPAARIMPSPSSKQGLLIAGATPRSKTNQPSFPLPTRAVESKKTILSIAEMQKISIRLYKAIGASRFSQAASIASDLYGEIINHAERASR